jgi:4-aminobutyrate aminotransferase-like enzyme
MPPKSFMKGVREICDKNGILMILDEVQTGFGRTGKWFGLEHFDIKPDILCFAKALSSGFPLSGIAASPEIQSKWVPGSHGGTMGANAVACAAATATLQVIKEEGLVEKAQVRGDQLRSLLHQLRERYPQIADIRGPGLMVAAEFYTQADDMRPFPNHDPRYAVKKGFAGAVTKKCVENGMLLLNTGIHETVRFIPALNVSKEELELGFDIFEQSMKETLKEYYVERDTEARPPQQQHQVPFFMPLNDEQGGKKMRM